VTERGNFIKGFVLVFGFCGVGWGRVENLPSWEGKCDTESAKRGSVSEGWVPKGL